MFTLEESYKAVEGRKEFAIKELPDTICFDYIIALSDSFNDDVYGWIRRNFRGITFCKHTGELLSLPLHKFYNVNQNEESLFDKHKHKSATVYEKADGSMIHCYKKKDGSLVASTCRSPESVQAIDAKAFIDSNPALAEQIHESIESGYTPVFEWCAPDNQIVVFYPEKQLKYLISRHRKTGLYIFEEKYTNSAKKYEIDFKDIFNHIDGSDMEGYVCHLEDNNIFKVKTPWYIDRHKSVDIFTRPKYKVMEMALDNILDDIIALANQQYKPVLLEIDSEVKNDLLNFKISVEKEFDALCEKLKSKKNDSDYRKTFALEAKQSENFSSLMNLFSGKSPDETIKKKLMFKYEALYPEKIMR